MKIYQVDSFTDTLFSGNPAAVCPLEGEWLSDELMQKIAFENNLSETAFVLKKDEGSWAIRWFTPVDEVELCGHATLAAAHVLFNHEGVSATTKLIFEANKHTLKVAYEGKLLVLDFPMDKIHQIDFTDELDCFNLKPKEAWRGTEEYILVYDNQAQIKNAICDLKKATLIDLCGFIITAPGASNTDFDFVSRYFSPKYGIDEDPVTGSAHTLLVPYWQKVLGKNEFKAYQMSARGGVLHCRALGDRALGDRVKIGGYATTFFAGEMFI